MHGFQTEASYPTRDIAAVVSDKKQREHDQKPIYTCSNTPNETSENCQPLYDLEMRQKTEGTARREVQDLKEQVASSTRGPKVSVLLVVYVSQRGFTRLETIEDNLGRVKLKTPLKVFASICSQPRI